MANWLPQGGARKVLASVFGLYLLGAMLLGMYWSIAPAPFDVQERAQALATKEGSSVVTGSVTRP